MSAPAAIPSGRHTADNFRAAIQPFHLVYFLLNVGDGDSQLVLLPEEPTGDRRLIVVDAAREGKTVALINALETAGLVGAAPAPGDDPDGSIALVVATHPHTDHIGGMAELLRTQRPRLAEFWDPGYFVTSQRYHQMMTEVEANSVLGYAQPAAGYRRWFGTVLVTVLSPAVGLRNRFDTYGTEINDSSISLRLEFPAARVVQRGPERELIPNPQTMALILGGDAQTLSWSYVLTDFPQLHTDENAAAKAIQAATGADPLAAKVLKVSHHASKHGINLELVERISPFAHAGVVHRQRRPVPLPAPGGSGTAPRGSGPGGRLGCAAGPHRCRSRNLLHVGQGRPRHPSWLDGGGDGPGSRHVVAVRR
jgi:beta-lactamase superfamily II metal-dependent hydrolase